MRFLKLLSLPTAVFLCLFLGITITAHDDLNYKSEHRFSNFTIAFPESVNKKSLKEYLRKELPKCPEVLDISSFGISEDDVNSVMNLVWIETVDLFNVNEIGYDSKNGMITELYFTFFYDADTFKNMYEEMEDAADKILYGIAGNDSLSDLEKTLLLHDKLAVWCEYDVNGVLSGAVADESFMMYGALVNRVAVCQGYAEAYMYLLEKCGIKSRICQSVVLDHAWNIVTLNGEDYHVDVTGDDPVYDITGNVSHEYFLVSTDKLKTLNRNADDYDSKPKNKQYDNAFWRNSFTQFCLVGDEIYYSDAKSMTVCKMSDKSNVFSVVDYWKFSSTQNWDGYYTRLATDGKYLFYNTATAVYEYNPSDKTNTVIWKPEIKTNAFFSIFGFTFEDNYLICDVANTPNFTAETKNNSRQTKYYNPIKPVVEFSVSNNVSDTQTVTFSVSDADSVVGYYFGSNSDYTKNHYTKTSSKCIGVDIFAAGTYYFTVKSGNGKLSETKKLIFYDVLLNSNGNVNTIIVFAGNTVVLPVNDVGGYAFCGWTTTADTSVYIRKLTVNSSVQCNAVFVKISDISNVSLNKYPEKVYIGDTSEVFDDIDLKILLKNGKTVYAAAGYKVSGCDLSKTGKKALNLTFYGFSIPFEVEVKAPYIKITVEKNIYYKTRTELRYVAEPENVNIEWSVSDTSVAVISDNKIVCNNFGEFSLTVSFVYGGKKYTDTLKLNVLCNHSQQETHSEVKSTCKIQGHGEYTECLDCGKIINGTDETLGYGDHMFVENTDNKYMVSEASCTSPAQYVKSCSECGIKSDEKFTFGEADESRHVSVELKAKDSTCSEEGNAAGYKCEVCGKILSGGEKTDKKPHTYKTAVTKPTCTDEGYTTYTCIVCKYKCIDDYVDAAGHSYVGKVTSPSCQNEGYTTYSCSVCKHKYVDDRVAAKGHEFTSTVREADCFNPSYSVNVCVTCGYKYSEEIAPKIKHADSDSDDKCDFCSTDMRILDDVWDEGDDLKAIIFEEGCDVLTLKLLLALSDAEVFTKDGEKLSDDDLPGTGCVVLVDGELYCVIVVIGDMDGNGTVTAADARLVLRVSATIDSPDGSQEKAADINDDGNITAADARLVLRKSALIKD